VGTRSTSVPAVSGHVQTSVATGVGGDVFFNTHGWFWAAPSLSLLSKDSNLCQVFFFFFLPPFSYVASS